MQEVRGSIPRLGGLRVSQLQASGGISTLQSRASGLQSTTQGNSVRTKRLLRVKQQKNMFANTVNCQDSNPSSWSRRRRARGTSRACLQTVKQNVRQSIFCRALTCIHDLRCLSSALLQTLSKADSRGLGRPQKRAKQPPSEPERLLRILAP